MKRSLVCEVIFGIDDAALKAKLAARPDVNGNEPARFVGTPSQIIDKIGAYVDAGAERVLLQWLDLDDLDGIEQLAKSVLPHFHQS